MDFTPDYSTKHLQINALLWEDNKFILCHKVLDNGSFHCPQRVNIPVLDFMLFGTLEVGDNYIGYKKYYQFLLHLSAFHL